MKVLVAYGSKHGGTAGIAAQIGETLRSWGLDAVVLPARAVRDVSKYDAVIVGGALYGMHWYADARSFVLRNAKILRERPVWFFSSGPLDESASRADIAPTIQVQQLMDFVCANGHVTFGGTLAPGARGFIAAKMAKNHAGDWRDPTRIAAWARTVANQLSDTTQPARAKPAPKPLPARLPLVALCLAAGLSAIVGGTALTVRPDGSLLRMPLSLLDHTPFHDFFLPGLLLLLVIGLGNIWAGVAHFRRSDYASLVSLFSGGALVIWMLVQMIMLRSFNWPEAMYLILGIAILAESIRQMRTMFESFGGPEPKPASG